MNVTFNSDVVVVGSINIDLTACTPRLPGPGETVGNGVLLREVGGKGANQAAAAARLGARTRMVGSVGCDSDGEWAVATLRDAGVDTSGVTQNAVSTGTALIVVDQYGENQIAVCPGANTAVILDNIEFGSGDVVIAQFEIGFETILKLAEEVVGYLVLNASPARDLPTSLVSRTDLFVVNEAEYAAMPELRHASAVAITYGARGAVLLREGKESAWADGISVTPVNSVGAGDAFCAALVLSLLADLDDDQALAVACRVGGEAVTHASSQPKFQRLSHYL